MRGGCECSKVKKDTWKKEGMRETEGEAMTYLMPSWITAFVSKHPNMHRSSTRDEIGPRHPISRGLLPLCRGAACARVGLQCVWVQAWLQTHICLDVFIDVYLLTPLSAWFIFKRTAHSSPHPHCPFLSFFFFPSSPSLYLFRSPPIHPSSKHLPSWATHPIWLLHTSLPSALAGPAGETISWIPARWKDFRFNTSPARVMASE